MPLGDNWYVASLAAEISAMGLFPAVWPSLFLTTYLLLSTLPQRNDALPAGRPLSLTLPTTSTAAHNFANLSA